MTLKGPCQPKQFYRSTYEFHLDLTAPRKQPWSATVFWVIINNILSHKSHSNQLFLICGNFTEASVITSDLASVNTSVDY